MSYGISWDGEVIGIYDQFRTLGEAQRRLRENLAQTVFDCGLRCDLSLEIVGNVGRLRIGNEVVESGRIIKISEER